VPSKSENGGTRHIECTPTLDPHTYQSRIYIEPGERGRKGPGTEQDVAQEQWLIAAVAQVGPEKYVKKPQVSNFFDEFRQGGCDNDICNWAREYAYKLDYDIEKCVR
jgi:hypothetical protein